MDGARPGTLQPCRAGVALLAGLLALGLVIRSDVLSVAAAVVFVVLVVVAYALDVSAWRNST